MRPRASKELAKLPDSVFLVEVATGLRLVLENASALFDDAVWMGEQERDRAAGMLNALAEEEAAKYLILLDAVRCPPKAPELGVQLGRFNNHLAKGIYAQYYHTRPATFGEAVEFIKECRADYYLDGPNDVDWIFRNAVLQERESRLYVDYVSTDEGNEWLTPMGSPQGLGYMPLEPPALRVSRTLDQVGCSEEGALKIIAREWRGVTFNRDDHWQLCAERNVKTLEALQTAGLLKSEDRGVLGTILWEWLFPLWSVDLSLVKVDREVLRQRQDEWTPDFW